MAEDCTDGDYLGAYSRFFAEFYARMNPHDLLPVAVSAYSVTEDEIVGEIISVTLQYLNQTVCPPILQAHLVHQVVQEIKATLKKLPEGWVWCGYKPQEKTYASLQLMQAITSKVNEICIRYLDNSRLALLPPPRSTPLPEATAAGIKNFRRKMEDRYVIVHDLHTTFGIQDDSIANYYAVFDGHAGQDAAVYCASHLHQYLVESVYYPNDPELAFRDAFLTTDARFIEKSKTQKVCGGTTAVCTLLIKKKLYVAWAGDSTAMLVKCDSVTQLVDPHRLTRNDEVQRVLNSGGVVMPSMGILRVNGVLSVSRAIGDVGYKPYVTGEPEVKCIPLDGTEDFLVLCSDGLSDFLGPKEISRLLYQEICLCQNPLEFTPQLLLKEAKRAGSEDNISVVVVLLTPASEIKNRTQNGRPIYRSLLLDLLHNMNEMDSVDSLYSTIMKQTMSSQETQSPADNDDILAPRNGKHENGDADYDYSDLGPETDVDAIDANDANDDGQTIQTMHVKNLSYDLYPNNGDDSSHNEEQVEKDDPETLDKNKINVENDLIERDAHIDREKYIDNDIRDDDDARVNDNIDVEEIAQIKDDARVDDVKVDASCDVVDDAGPVDYDESPPSPQATKPLQHALIPEADNVADSEDSEDEWNYYRVDPNKEKESATAIDEPRESKTEEVSHSPDLPIEDNNSEIQSQEAEEDIKCESPKEEESPELIDTEISAEDKLIEEREDKTFAEDKQELRDMDFQLNPDAAEFVPVSPQMLGNRMNLIEDYPISGSPLKQVPQMDDIQVPSETEFDEGICRRPREIETDEKDCTNGDHIRPTDYTDFMVNRQKGVGILGNLDDSEISSTKAEFGDESASFLTASEFHRTGVSTVDESFSSSERDYDIAKDPMVMSFTPSDFEALFDKGVDLNAVHDLSNIDFDDKNGIIEEEVEEKSPDLLPELSTLTSPEIEQPVHTTAFPDGKPTDLVNISSQQEDNESTFIEHVVEEPTVTTITDYPDTEVECQSSQVESSEQQDLFKAEHSPVTDNYSTEFESEKETTSVDNEQLLSPSIADVDETKPIDETSEDAPLSVTDSQKETCARETDTPSSLSPIPDVVECTSPQKEEDLIASMENVQISSPVPIESPLDTHEPEPKPDQYNFDPFSSESIVANDTSELTLQDNMNASNPFAPVDEKSSEVVFTTLSTTETVQEAVKQNLLDFSVEEEVCAKSPIEKMEVESTTPLSPQETDDELPKDINDFACPIEPSIDFKDSNNVKSEEEFINTDVCELQTQKHATCDEIYEPEAIKLTPALNLSESMQEFTGLEKQLQPEDVSVKSTVVEFEEKVIATEEEPKDEVQQKEFVAQEIKDTNKEVVEEKVLSPIPLENKESVVEEPEEKIVEAVAVAAAATATVAAVTGAITAQSKTKAKPGAKLTKPPQAKAAPKSTPTSPSKMTSSTARATTAATAKKSTTTTTARPKELDASKKPPISSTTTKVSASKPAPASKTTTSTASKVTARTSTGLSKTKTTTASQKPSSSVTDKKPTANGDVKPLSKPAATKTLTKPATTTGAAPKTTLQVKPPSSTRTSISATTKTRPTSAVASATKTTTKPTSTMSTTTASNAARPKTAPVTGNATKVRTSTAKSPMIDKQIKETANKQISLARTSASSTTKTSRTSTSATSTTTTTVKRTSTAKITSTSSSPMKKSTPTSKLSAKTTSASKTTSSTGKVKVVQNGVSESIQMTNTIVTTTNSKLGDDVPMKDLSPIVVLTDNQLIMSSD